MHKGPHTARVMVLGEAPGENEAREGIPFVGASGMELDRMLREAGFDPAHIFFTNVTSVRPPRNDIDSFFFTSKKEALANNAHYIQGRYCTQEIFDGLNQLTKTLENLPNLQLIIPVGNTALWALTGYLGITKWRGSQITLPSKLHVVPTYHPALILRAWENRFPAVLDLRRAKRWLDSNFEVPTYDFMVRPSFSDVSIFLTGLLDNLRAQRVELSVDLETRNRHIACIGIATSNKRALCIPFFTAAGQSYFPIDQEIEIVYQLYQILTHPNAFIIGQNFLYDLQYIAKRWGFQCNFSYDTMIAHHVIFPTLPKGLDYLSSFYNEFHLYWKDESKDWDPKLGEAQLWYYNCKDACATFEAYTHITGSVAAFNMQHLVEEQFEFARVAFKMMLSGIRCSLEAKAQVAKELQNQMSQLEAFIHGVLGYPLMITSPKQVMHLAYEILKLPPIYKERQKGIKTLSADKEAIEQWCITAEPVYRPILRAIQYYRSLSVYLNTFALAPVDPDGRFRCSINPAGANTFRWATSEDAFGYGTNMQNIPKGDKD